MVGLRYFARLYPPYASGASRASLSYPATRGSYAEISVPSLIPHRPALKHLAVKYAAARSGDSTGKRPSYTPQVRRYRKMRARAEATTTKLSSMLTTGRSFRKNSGTMIPGIFLVFAPFFEAVWGLDRVPTSLLNKAHPLAVGPEQYLRCTLSL